MDDHDEILNVEGGGSVPQDRLSSKMSSTTECGDDDHGSDDKGQVR